VTGISFRKNAQKCTFGARPNSANGGTFGRVRKLQNRVGSAQTGTRSVAPACPLSSGRFVARLDLRR
jgi:hypothetical protein